MVRIQRANLLDPGAPIHRWNVAARFSAAAFVDHTHATACSA